MFNEPKSADRPIADYAVIGNGRTAALVARNGSIDWCCWPRFDGPAVFCRLLDARHGGAFRIEPAGPYETSRRYVEATNILETTFRTPDGEVRLSDFMPAPSDSEDGRIFPHRLLRRIEGLASRVEVDIEFRPTFDYGRASAELILDSRGALARTEQEALSLVSPVPLEPAAGALTGRTTIAAGERVWLILTHSPPAEARDGLRLADDDAEAEWNRTVEYWLRWSGACTWDGPYRDLVLRSALVLKLLIFEPSGGLIAAPTTSLPETMGGVRNWDYRYCWLRDSGLMLDVMQQLGYHDESLHFIDWLERICLDCREHLQIAYAVDGGPAPAEARLDHLAGYRGSRPVRIGNDAARQVQLDASGHVIDAVSLCIERMPRPVRPELWELLRGLADRAADEWRIPDRGPWETQAEPQHHLYSKLYCWVALDRALKLSARAGLPADTENWIRERQAIREAILTQGYREEVGAFTQAFGSTALDASALTISLAGFLPPTDPRVLSTISRIRDELAQEGLVYRYLRDDGLPGREGSFALCSFWLVSNLALAGRLEEARELFDHVCGHANDVGLLSEQIDTRTGELLGNFPQGFTHLGLIRAALHLAHSV